MNNNKYDIISKALLKLIIESIEPVETKEIEELLKKKLKDITRTKIFYRLMLLMSRGSIQGKQVGPGRGAWIWWSKDDKKEG